MIKQGMVHEHYRKVILCEEDELSQEHAIQWHKKERKPVSLLETGFLVFLLLSMNTQA
ncbi:MULTISPECIES: hypothetical protein [Paenibacillus]|uniref:Uncharacterized protein n=1 Tax=Paenibacillus cucumis (ex Kampfer et al. 2016) TaxID=1776858 RepID=A0ABS7KIC9_9BACL|nr:hypothetical protein [Paenibacillus cucumis (ex Kampfer et al. 2016)]